MATPTTDDLVAQVLAFLPEAYQPLKPILSAGAASAAEVLAAGEANASGASVGGAEGIWLDLLARGYGLRRRTGEEDALLRLRLRAPEGKLTRGSIQAAVDRILTHYNVTGTTRIWWRGGFLGVDAYAGFLAYLGQHWEAVETSGRARVVEWWQVDGYLDHNLFCGVGRLATPNTFLILIPKPPSTIWYGAFLGVDGFADHSAYLGSGVQSAELYAFVSQVVEEVFHIRAAGVRAFVATEVE